MLVAVDDDGGPLPVCSRIALLLALVAVPSLGCGGAVPPSSNSGMIAPAASVPEAAAHGGEHPPWYAFRGAFAFGGAFAVHLFYEPLTCADLSAHALPRSIGMVIRWEKGARAAQIALYRPKDGDVTPIAAQGGTAVATLVEANETSGTLHLIAKDASLGLDVDEIVDVVCCP